MLLAAVNDPSAQTGAEPAAAAAASFGVAEYRVLGNAVLPATDIERVLYPLLGEQKTLDDVEKARAALEALYRERGYGTVFVDIPEQNVDEGIVRLHVTEGTIARVRVAGARYFSNREIRAAVPAAAPGSAPHLPTVQKQLAALNAQTPDRSVVPVLKAGPRPGTVDLALNVTDNVPAHLTTEINDQYTSNTSRLRASVAVNYDNLFDRLDSIALQYQTSPQEPAEVSVWAGSYTLRLPESAAKVALFYIDSNSDVATVGDAGASVSVLGKGKIFGARYIDPFYTAADATHVFIGSAEYKDFAESVFASDFLRTPISYLNFAAGHTSAWRLDKQWTLANTVNFGARGVSNSEEEFRLKRARGIANYWFLRSDVGWSMTLPWTLNLRVRGSGQYAVDPIISNEQFSIAGADGVRGYREAEQLGDVGVKTSRCIGNAGCRPACRARDRTGRRRGADERIVRHDPSDAIAGRRRHRKHARRRRVVQAADGADNHAGPLRLDAGGSAVSCRFAYFSPRDHSRHHADRPDFRQRRDSGPAAGSRRVRAELPRPARDDFQLRQLRVESRRCAGSTRDHVHCVAHIAACRRAGHSAMVGNECDSVYCFRRLERHTSRQRLSAERGVAGNDVVRSRLLRSGRKCFFVGDGDCSGGSQQRRRWRVRSVDDRLPGRYGTGMSATFLTQTASGVGVPDSGQVSRTRYVRNRSAR